MTAPDPARRLDLEHARKDPTSVFRSPRAVLEAPGLSLGDRRAILEQWELDARRLEGSADEGMGGGEPPMLAEVRAALRELEAG